MNVSLSPKLRQFVEKRVRDGLYEDASDVVRAALRVLQERDRITAQAALLDNFALSVGGGDIEALAFVVLMQATNDMDKDLKMIMAEVKSMTAAKQRLRDLICKVRKDVSNNAGQKESKQPLSYSHNGMGSERAYHRAQMPIPDPEAKGGVRLLQTDLHDERINEVTQLKAILDDLIGKLDSMSELSEELQIRLQMYMDRRSKMFETMSNIMKKASDTQQSIIGNLK